MSNLTYNGVSIQADDTTYINATQMGKAAGKDGRKWFDNQSTSEFIYELALDKGLIPDRQKIGFGSQQWFQALKNTSWFGLVKIIKGGNGPQGTWIHPDLAIHFAMWCDPKFAVQVSKWVRELLTTGSVTLYTAKSGGSQHKHLMQYSSFESEDVLQDGIHSFVNGICGHKYLEREYPILNISSNKPKTRRLDFICFYPRLVQAIEIKNVTITPSLISDTFGNKGYYSNLESFVKNRAINNRNKHIRNIKFLLLSTYSLPNTSKDLINLIPNLNFMTVNDYCYKYYCNALATKYKDSPWFLNEQVINKYFGLFKPEFIQALK